MARQHAAGGCRRGELLRRRKPQQAADGQHGDRRVDVRDFNHATNDAGPTLAGVDVQSQSRRGSNFSRVARPHFTDPRPRRLNGRKDVKPVGLQAFLRQQDLLGPLDYKVAAGIVPAARHHYGHVELHDLSELSVFLHGPSVFGERASRRQGIQNFIPSALWLGGGGVERGRGCGRGSGRPRPNWSKSQRRNGGGYGAGTASNLYFLNFRLDLAGVQGFPHHALGRLGAGINAVRDIHDDRRRVRVPRRLSRLGCN